MFIFLLFLAWLYVVAKQPGCIGVDEEDYDDTDDIVVLVLIAMGAVLYLMA